MDKRLKQLVEEPLSNVDLSNFLNDINIELHQKNKINIFTVEQAIENPRLFNTRLNKNGYCIFFINPQGSAVGHWTIMFKNSRNEYFFFDSYGNNPKALDINLFGFLMKYYKDLIYNTFQYQQYNAKIATCGRYSTLILGLLKIHPDLDVDVIHKIMVNYKKQLKLKTYDEVVSRLVNFDI